MTTLALCAITAATFTNATAAEGSDSISLNNEPTRQHVQTIIETREVSSAETALRSNTSVIAQIGNDNRARVNQSRYRSAAASGNYANISQRGTNNEANIMQSGSNNIGAIGQIGRDHEATIEQAGNGFEAQVNQRGIKSNINISQSGSGYRSISVMQNSVSGMAAPVTIHTN